MSTVLPAAAEIPADRRSLRLSRLSDELLARSAARGSQRSFGVLYERYHQPLYRYCRSIVRNEADAQDVLQSTFTAALAALKRDARKAPLRPWLYRIAHNESISLLRRRTREAQHQSEGEVTALAASAEEEAASRARWQRLLEDLAELPERQRGALLLREMAGLSHEDIAVALELTLGGAKQAIFEARQGLADLEEGRAMSCEEIRQRISEGDRRVLRARRVRAHLRECVACEAFATAIPSRQTDLRAMVPALPPAAAAAILGGVMRAASPHGGSAAGSALSTGAVTKAAALIGWKAVAGVALVAGTAAGVAGLTHATGQTQAAGHLAVRSAPHRAVFSPRPSAAAHRAAPGLGGSSAAAGSHARAHGSAAHATKAVRRRGRSHSRPAVVSPGAAGHSTGRASAPGQIHLTPVHPGHTSSTLKTFRATANKISSRATSQGSATATARSGGLSRSTGSSRVTPDRVPARDQPHAHK